MIIDAVLQGFLFTETLFAIFVPTGRLINWTGRRIITRDLLSRPDDVLTRDLLSWPVDLITRDALITVKIKGKKSRCSPVTS